MGVVGELGEFRTPPPPPPGDNEVTLMFFERAVMDCTGMEAEEGADDE